MQQRTEFIKDIIDTIKLENLVSLSDNEYQYKDLNVLKLSTSKTDCVNQSFKKFVALKNEWDLINCNKDLKLLTAHLFFFRPLINNPVEESHIIEGSYLSTYFQNDPDWFYSTYVSCCFEKLYNFWDRVGDALAFYLNLDIKESQVNFSKVIDLMVDSGRFENENFVYLLNFKKSDFKDFNSLRKDIVHYYQFETTFRWEHTKKCSNESKIKDLWDWKYGMPEFFKQHLQTSCEGYYRMYKLINNLP